jgi:hypothetical protein
MDMDDSNKPVVNGPPGGIVKTIVASILATSLATGCTSILYPETPGDIPAHTRLALSPNGKRLLVHWRENSGKLQTRLWDLDGEKIKSISFPPLPEDTYTAAFAKDNNHVLVTTWNTKSSSLLKLDVDSNDVEKIYESQKIMRLPLEVTEQNYVFLETYDEKNQFSRWHRLDHGKKSVLNNQGYNMIAPLNVLGESLFLIEPDNKFRVIDGSLPAGLNTLVDESTFYIVCADKAPLTCLKSRLYFDHEGLSYSRLEIINGKQRCSIDGKWVDSRERMISRDGSTVVFHAAIKKHGGERAIYIAHNKASGCTAESVDIKGIR